MGGCLRTSVEPLKKGLGWLNNVKCIPGLKYQLKNWVDFSQVVISLPWLWYISILVVAL